MNESWDGCYSYSAECYAFGEQLAGECSDYDSDYY